MHVNKTRALAGVALVSAFSVILLLLGTFISVNTLFFTAFAAYLIGFSMNKYQPSYGAMQLVVCTFLDIFLNPNKFHWILYLCLGGYIFLSEMVFKKWNRIDDKKKKMFRQIFYNAILFNAIYIPLLWLGRSLLFPEMLPGGISRSSVFGTILLWGVGQIGWFVYDRAYLVFCRTMKERGIR